MCLCTCGAGSFQQDLSGAAANYQFVLKPILEEEEVIYTDDLINDSVSHKFLDSLLYYMLPSLLTFCTFAVGFYILHEFTTDRQMMGFRQNMIRKKASLMENIGCSSMQSMRSNPISMNNEPVKVDLTEHEETKLITNENENSNNAKAVIVKEPRVIDV